MGSKNVGGNHLPECQDSWRKLEAFLKTADNATLSKRQYIVVNLWIKKFKIFSSGWKKREYFKPPLEIASWCYKQKYLYLAGNLPGWKVDLLNEIDFKKYCSMQRTYERDKTSIKTGNERRLLIGEKVIANEINANDKHDMEWLSKLALYIECKQSNKSHKDIKNLSVWIKNNKERFVSNSLPAWKISALKEAGFEEEIIYGGRNIGKYIPTLQKFFDGNNSFKNEPTKEFRKLYAWRNSFVSNSSAGKTNLFLSKLVNVTEKKKIDFLSAEGKSLGRGFSNEERNQFTAEAKKYIFEQNMEFEDRFSNQTADQVRGILSRLSKSKKLTPIEYDALNWLNQFLRLSEEIVSQNKKIIDLELNKADHIFLRLTRNGFLRNELFNWQIKYLSSIDFKYYADSSGSSSFYERNVKQLRLYYSEHNSIVVDDSNEAFIDIYHWRKRMARVMRKIPVPKWESKVMFVKLRGEFPDVNMAEWVSFFLDIKRSNKKNSKFLSDKIIVLNNA